MLQLSALQAVRSVRRWIGVIRTGNSRPFSTIFPGEQPVTEVHRSRVEADGKAFTFAVVATDLEKSHSPLPAWSHACSLLTNNPPTLALAFVSKNTPSSAAAVAEISKTFSDTARIDPPPFIGCVADLWAAGAPASTSPDGAADRAKLHGKRGSTELVANAVVKAAGGEDSEEEDFKDLVGECARWSRANPGVVPDEENRALSSLDKELEARKSDEKEERKMVLEEGSDENRKEVVTGDVHAGKGGGVVEEGGGGGGSGGGSLQQGSISRRASHSDSESSGDDGYRLVLCVAHMPETKTAAFHTTTTGVPNLPDMEAAILRNNPHMLLLGAPGYPFPEFVQRLSTLFPESGRLQSRCISVAPSF